MKTEKEIIEEIREINRWTCPHQLVKFVGYDKNGNKIYLLSQMGGGHFSQRTIIYQNENPLKKSGAETQQLLNKNYEKRNKRGNRLGERYF